jgi:aldehyde:ferredoxin oxidoreductase
MLHGYAGRIGWIDLGEGTVKIDRLEEEIARKYLGGKGLGAYLLYTHLAPGTDPLDPSNVMIFLNGPLTGTHFPAVSRSGVVTKSPQTGAFLDSYSGGSFGSRLKWAGFDGLVIRGKARSPSYLLVEDGSVSIRDAGDLWGLTTSGTEERLRRAHSSGGRMSVASIGPAGENLVRFANIINERRAHGRGGAGAVMGSKNLKAIAVRGGGKPRLADEEGFNDVVRRCREKLAAHPMTGKGGLFPRMGTMMTVDVTQKTGTLPTRNWQENVFADAEKINGEAFLDYAVRPRSCFSCPIGCSRDTKATVGQAEYVTEGPDYETIYAFGSNCGISDPGAIIAADRLCDDLGLDTISCGAAVGFAMECAEKGLLPREYAGIDPRFGDSGLLPEIIRSIAERTGIGELLSEGVKRASERMAGSGPYAMHVKGLELPGYDPRGMKGQGLTYAVSDRGGCHVRANTLRTELLGIPKPVDRFTYEGKAQMARTLQMNIAAYDSIISCLFGSFAVTLEDYAGAISAATGWNMTPEELLKVAERAWNLSRLFNCREGFGRKDDTLPERLFVQPSTAGPSSGQVVDRPSFEKMLDEYYESMGWNKETGVPTEAKLIELGLWRP